MFRIFKLNYIRYPLLLGFYFSTNKKIFMTEMPPKSEIVRGQYENKIKKYSQPEKIFEMYASVYEKGVLKMSREDLLKALSSFMYCKQSSPPNQFQAQNLFGFTDSNKDNTISLYEFFTILVLISCDDRKFRDLHKNNAYLTKQQVKNVLKTIILESPNKIKQNLLFLESRKVTVNQQDFLNTIQSCTDNFFKNQKYKTVEQIVELKWKILSEIYQYQFYRIPRDQSNTIDANDFAKSLLRYVRKRDLNKYLKISNNISNTARVNIDQYVNFHLFLQNQLPQLENFLETKGVITSDKIYQMMSGTLQKNKRTINRAQTDILMNLLDTDNSGFIEKKELVHIMQTIKYYSNSVVGSQDIWSRIKHDFQKGKKKFQKIIDIINQ